MKLIAKTKDGDIFEVRLQKMFPNCEKYNKCCTDDKDFWDILYKKVESVKPRKQPFRIIDSYNKSDITRNVPPEGFEKW